MNLMCCAGLPPQHVKAFLLHCEGDGKPHCVSVQIASIATVSDGNTVHSISLKSFQDAVQSATDSSTMVSYWQAGAKDKLSAECAALSDMEAGAGACGSHGHQGDMEMLYVQEVGGDNSDDEDQAQTCKPKIFERSDEGTLFVCDNILEMMAQEVQTVLGDLSGHIVKQDGRKLWSVLPISFIHNNKAPSSPPNAASLEEKPVRLLRNQPAQSDLSSPRLCGCKSKLSWRLLAAKRSRAEKDSVTSAGTQSQPHRQERPAGLPRGRSRVRQC